MTPAAHRKYHPGMCGRFTREFSWRQVHDFLDITWPSIEEMGPAYKIAPTQHIPVCHLDNADHRRLSLMQWGFLPAWATADTRPLINARSETVATSAMFRGAFKSRRCLVPASGFYEWKKLPDDRAAKVPMYIRLINDPILCFAGIWETSRPHGESNRAPVTSAAILTTRPNELMAGIHDRMPVIIPPDRFDAWLHPDTNPKSFFEPFPAELMEAFPVSTRVNSPRNDDASLVRPTEPPRSGAEPSAGNPGLFG